MQIPVVIYGSSGRVGSQLAKYIQDLDNPPFRVVGMVEHSSHILDRSGVLETQFTVSLRA